MTPDKKSFPAGVMALAGTVKSLNRWIALICGGVLLATVVLILLEILDRRLALLRISGADEISGYVMAGIATWGFSYALVERAHVRIDIAYAKLSSPGRALFDLLALASMLFVAVLVAYYAGDVLSKSLTRGARSNTPLAIELWIPQVIWFAGWVWFAITSAAMLGCTLALTFARQWSRIDELSGMTAETGDSL